MIITCFRLALEELCRIWRDKSVFSLMIIAGLFYIAFYPQPYLNEATRDIPIIVIDHDQSISSQKLLLLIDASEGAKIVARADNLASAKAQLLARKAYGIVLIPHYFEREILAGRASPVALYGDGNYFLIYGKLAAGVGGAVATMGGDISLKRLVAQGLDPVAAMGLAVPLQSSQVALFNPQGGYATYVLPAAFILIMQQTLWMGVGLLWKSRTRNRYEIALREDYGSSFLIILITTLSKIFSYMTLYGFFFWLYTIVVPSWYNIPQLGAVWDLFLVSIPLLLSICLLGIIISYLLPSREAVVLLISPLGMILFFLSGISWPHEAMPDFIRYISYVFPTTAGIDAVVRINQMGATVANLRFELGVLWVLVMIYGSIAMLLAYKDSLTQTQLEKS
ncbi:membrane protein [Gammaproteobacteria bacterium]|nr:membrane protein [Gammaproteobacteria bacterium]